MFIVACICCLKMFLMLLKNCLPLRIKVNPPELYAINFNQSIPPNFYHKKTKERLSSMSRFIIVY
jgi:hypothetical protein